MPIDDIEYVMYHHPDLDTLLQWDPAFPGL